MNLGLPEALRHLQTSRARLERLTQKAVALTPLPFFFREDLEEVQGRVTRIAQFLDYLRTSSRPYEDDESPTLTIDSLLDGMECGMGGDLGVPLLLSHPPVRVEHPKPFTPAEQAQVTRSVRHILRSTTLEMQAALRALPSHPDVNQRRRFLQGILETCHAHCNVTDSNESRLFRNYHHILRAQVMVLQKRLVRQ